MLGAHGNDENSPPCAARTQLFHAVYGKKPHRNACSRLAISTTATNSSSCLGVLPPQGLIDGQKDKPSTAQQQLEVEQCRSTHLELELQQAHRKLAEFTARETDLQQQLTAKDKQLQQLHRVVAAAEAARQKAAADCNNSAGIALKHVEQAQQLQQVVQQQAQRLRIMQQQLHECAGQLSFARKLHVHTAALLSVRELQLSEALQHQEQQGSQQHAVDEASAIVTLPRKQDQAQQQNVKCSTEAAELMAPLPAGVVLSHELVQSVAVKQHVDCDGDDCGGKMSSTHQSLLSIDSEEEEEGASTPVACHPARPAQPALVASKHRSRLSLAEQFDAAATASGTGELSSSDAAAFIVGCDQHVGEVTDTCSDLVASSNVATACTKVKPGSRSNWLKRLIKHKDSLY